MAKYSFPANFLYDSSYLALIVNVDIEFEDGSREEVYNVDSVHRTEDGIRVVRNVRGVPVTDADDTRANSITREHEGEESLEFPDGVIISVSSTR
jgi:hypothetical protein